ncbi:PREDICTED: acyl-coenzyme A thioesterase 1-like [Nanorana parkeri]|uniref:acyl-coenzyme A thioesterase 1-like n=1 Tax=Nanorana parkeri TaxID=125878 RepID=UPI0008549CAC|nr:PREDICTED: acyl-coenzyme A thioesterase 1-like [Nanorana parkeri]
MRSMSGAVQLRVCPERCLFDDPLRVQVSGLIPGQEVTLRTELTDEGGELFTSLGRYLSHNAKLSLIYKTPHVELCLPPESDPLLLEKVKQHKMLNQSSKGKSTGPGPFPGIIDLYGTGGGLMEHRASLLANHGFATMALAFFDYDDLPNNLGGLHLDYFREGLEFLRRHPKVNKQEIGIIGLSKGADLAITMATFLPGVKAVVSISGCNANTMAPLPCDGFVQPCLGFSAEKIKFTEAGEADLSEFMEDPMDPAFQECLIPAERSSASFLLLSGLDDKNWPSALYTKQFVARLKEHNKDVESCYYPGAGHLLEPPYFPLCKASKHKLLGMPMLWGGQLRAHAKAQEDAWKRILTFFSKQLKANITTYSRL